MHIKLEKAISLRSSLHCAQGGIVIGETGTQSAATKTLLFKISSCAVALRFPLIGTKGLRPETGKTAPDHKRQVCPCTFGHIVYIVGKSKPEEAEGSLNAPSRDDSLKQCLL